MKIALTLVLTALLTAFAATPAFAQSGVVQQIEVRTGGIIITVGNQRAALCPTLPDSFKNAIVNIAVASKTQNKPVAFILKKPGYGATASCLDSIAF
jgi:hypothetical protein